MKKIKLFSAIYALAYFNDGEDKGTIRNFVKSLEQGDGDDGDKDDPKKVKSKDNDRNDDDGDDDGDNPPKSSSDDDDDDHFSFLKKGDAKKGEPKVKEDDDDDSEFEPFVIDKAIDVDDPGTGGEKGKKWKAAKTTIKELGKKFNTLLEKYKEAKAKSPDNSEKLTQLETELAQTRAQLTDYEAVVKAVQIERHPAFRKKYVEPFNSALAEAEEEVAQVIDPSKAADAKRMIQSLVKNPPYTDEGNRAFRTSLRTMEELLSKEEVDATDIAAISSLVKAARRAGAAMTKAKETETVQADLDSILSRDKAAIAQASDGIVDSFHSRVKNGEDGKRGEFLKKYGEALGYDKLVVAAIPKVKALVKKTVQTGIPPEELIQLAVLGAEVPYLSEFNKAQTEEIKRLKDIERKYRKLSGESDSPKGGGGSKPNRFNDDDDDDDDDTGGSTIRKVAQRMIGQ